MCRKLTKLNSFPCQWPSNKSFTDGMPTGFRCCIGPISIPISVPDNRVHSEPWSVCQNIQQNLSSHTAGKMSSEELPQAFVMQLGAKSRGTLFSHVPVFVVVAFVVVCPPQGWIFRVEAWYMWGRRKYPRRLCGRCAKYIYIALFSQAEELTMLLFAQTAPSSPAATLFPCLAFGASKTAFVSGAHHHPAALQHNPLTLHTSLLCIHCETEGSNGPLHLVLKPEWPSVLKPPMTWKEKENKAKPRPCPPSLLYRLDIWSETDWKSSNGPLSLEWPKPWNSQWHKDLG